MVVELAAPAWVGLGVAGGELVYVEFIVMMLELGEQDGSRGAWKAILRRRSQETTVWF